MTTPLRVSRLSSSPHQDPRAPHHVHTPSPSPHYPPRPPLPSFPSPPSPARTHASSLPNHILHAAARRPAPAHPPSAAPSRRSQRGSGCSGSAATGTRPRLRSYPFTVCTRTRPALHGRAVGTPLVATLHSTCTQCTLLISLSPLCACDFRFPARGLAPFTESKLAA